MWDERGEGRGRGGSLTAVTYIAVVSRWAEMVPRGMDPWGSFREAERFDPAMIPVTEGKKSPASAPNDHATFPSALGNPFLSVGR